MNNIFVGIGDALHDTSICALIDGEFKYRKSERYFGVKHHEAKSQWYANTLNDWNITKVDKLVYTHKGGIGRGRKPYDGEEFLVNESFPHIKCNDTICLDHHIAHMFSTLSSAKQHAVFDGKGSGSKAKGRFTGLIKTETKFQRYKKMGAGRYLQYLGTVLNFSGLEIDFPGKIMGLQSYGVPDLNLASQINEENILDFIEPWVRKIPKSTDKDFQNFVATVHKACELQQLEYFKEFDSNELIACSGGVMLNTVINTELRKKYNLYIPPHVYDGGLSIGCLNYIVKNLNIPNFPFIQDDERPLENPSDDTIEFIAEKLALGKIIGWYQGNGEIGPRALGNRSILMSPLVKNGKEILNQKVKKREWWRPFGASVIKEKAHEYFDIDNNPYMLYNSKVLVDELYSITHVDGTCRHQTVTSDHKFYYKLLEKFEEKTGLPILLNTSLNIGGKPISSKLENAHVPGLDILCCGNEIHSYS
jgi:carbamoyltransferase